MPHLTPNPPGHRVIFKQNTPAIATIHGRKIRIANSQSAQNILFGKPLTAAEKNGLDQIDQQAKEIVQAAFKKAAK